MRKRIAIPMVLLGLASALALTPIAADAAVSDAAVIALNSIEFDKFGTVTGDVVVNDVAGEPTLAPGFELSVDKFVRLGGDVLADSIDLDRKAEVSGTVGCNDGVGVACGGLDLPVFDLLPVFRPAVVDPGAPVVVVGRKEAVTLPAGSYGHIETARGATLELSGGGYDIASIDGGRDLDIVFLGPTQLRVAGDITFDKYTTIAAGPGLSGRDLVIYASGNVDIDKNFTGAANFYLEATCVAEDDDGNCVETTGLFSLDKRGTLVGSLIASDADFDKGAQITLDSAFNLAPTADGQTVETLGVDPIVITLTGSDPDGDALTFTIVAGPSAGAITAGPTPVGPTSATVTYDAAVEGAADQFVFRVDDGKGGSDNAAVDINPSDDTPDPPDLAGILAKDDELEVVQGAVDVPITLVAAAPIAPQPDPIGDLTFAITSAPDQGGSVTTPVSTAEVPVRSATVEYTPLAGFTGIETFGFEACEATAPANCDQGEITISVEPATPPAPPVAVPQNVSLAQGTEIEINLAVPIAQDGPTDETGREGQCGNGELDPGEQCDDGNLLNGDGCDDQCMDEPQ